MAYADISTAVNRCITTNSMRSELVSQVLEIADLDLVIHVTKELRQTRITKDKDEIHLCIRYIRFEEPIKKVKILILLQKIS